MHLNTLLNVFNSTIDRLEKKTDILKEKLIKDEVNKKLDIYSRVKEVKLDETTEDFVTKTKNKLADLEDRIRGNNLRFDGFQEETSETWEKRESTVTEFGKETLGIEEDILIEKAHLRGKIQRNDRARTRKRTIIVKFLNFKDKSRILHTYRKNKLWKEKILIN